MRIVYCIHSLHNSGGMERVLTLKANALSALPGYEVHIIAAALHGRKPCFEPAPAVRIHDLDCNEHLRPRRFARCLEALLTEIRPDITISLCGSELRFLPSLRDGSVKMAEFHFSHDKFLLKYGSRGLKGWYARRRTRKLENAVARLDRFVVLTREDQAAWQQALPGFPVEQIYNPLTFLPEDCADTSCRRAIAAGRLMPQKNFADAVDAWVPVAAKHPDWTLDIYGSGPLKDSLEKRIAEKGLQGKVRLMGLTRNMQQELLRSGFYLMSSRFEGFPMVLLEAAACGLPVVSYRCPCGPSEIVEEGRSGRLVPAGDTAALSEAILRMIESDDRAAMGQAIRSDSAQFALPAIIAQWQDLFVSVRNGKAAAADGQRP